MRLTVCICTYNRALMLRQALQSLASSTIPPDVTWEVIVVNNNCSDNTDEVVTSFSDLLPIKLLHESKQGKSHSLNLAIGNAESDHILFTDDDAIVDSQWMAQYCLAFKELPNVSFWGGKIEPWFDGTPPSWLQAGFSSIQSAFATLDLGTERQVCSRSLLPYGVNMAVQTEIHKRYQYDVALGPKPNSEVRGEESEVCLRMLQDGHLGMWIPTAKVRHFIPRERQTLRYIRRYFAGNAETNIRTSGQSTNLSPRQFAGVPRWAIRKALELEISYRSKRLFYRNPAAWLSDLASASMAWGLVRTYYSTRNSQHVVVR